MARAAVGRGLGSPALFAIVYSTAAGALYFSLGVVAGHALGLTPVVFLAAGLFLGLTAMTYVEGSSLHQERGGSFVFARYAFNELWSFVAGWAILLDYAILIAITAFSVSHYLATFWGPFGGSAGELAVAGAVIAYVATVNVRGITAHRFKRLAGLALWDLGVQALIILLGLAIVFDAPSLVGQVRLGAVPSWRETIYALTIAAIAFTGLESAAGLAGEIKVGRRGLRRLVSSGAGAALFIYVGMSLVALSALPVAGGKTALGGEFEERPVVGVVSSYDPSWLANVLKYAVAATAAVVLLAAANSAMLGLSRLAYSLATNRQIPSALGRLHPTRSTPMVVIGIASIVSFALVLPADIEFLAGIYAFGVLLAFTIAHLSICVLRYREPDRDRPYRIPLSIQLAGGSLPLPAVLGAVLSFAAWVSVLALHSGARLVGSIWMIFGLTLYLVYRSTQGKPIFGRVVIPEAALREEPPEVEYDLILVPVFGSELDDDIVQTAGRLAAEEQRGEGQKDELTPEQRGLAARALARAGVDRPRQGERGGQNGDPPDDAAGKRSGPVIEALYVLEVPMSLPLEARLPETQIAEGRRALARAKAVGEEYEGVEVAPVLVRARRTGEAIVEIARTKNVQVIVLAAEEKSRIRTGARLGGRGGPLDNFVGETTKYVIDKAPCRVLLTAPGSREEEDRAEAGEEAQAQPPGA